MRRRRSFAPASSYVEAVYRRKIEELDEPHPARPMTSDAIRSMLSIKRRYFDRHLADYKYETLELVRGGRLRAQTLVLWGLNDPTAPARVGFAIRSFAVV